MLILERTQLPSYKMLPFLMLLLYSIVLIVVLIIINNKFRTVNIVDRRGLKSFASGKFEVFKLKEQSSFTILVGLTLIVLVIFFVQFKTNDISKINNLFGEQENSHESSLSLVAEIYKTRLDDLLLEYSIKDNKEYDINDTNLPRAVNFAKFIYSDFQAEYESFLMLKEAF